MHDIARSIDTRPRVVASTVEWPTLALIVACYAMWLVAGIGYAAAPFISVPLLMVAIVLHSSLQHEAIHRHPTRSGLWNEALVSLPLGVLVPYRRYRRLHLLHHVDSRLTDPYDDPESFYIARHDWARLPRALQVLLEWNNMLAVRLVIGPAISAVVFLSTELRGLASADDRHDRRRNRIAWALHAAGVAAVVTVVQFVFAMPFNTYLLAAYLALSVLGLRSFCEHRWAERPEQRTVIVEDTRLGLLFLNNNLHAVHHADPRVPWYGLPARYRERRDEWRQLNGGYVFRGYGAVLRRFAFHAKEPVAHPVRSAARPSAPKIRPPGGRWSWPATGRENDG